MAFRDLLRLIPKHERERVRLADATQRALLELYAAEHSVISREITSLINAPSRDDRARIQTHQLSALRDWIADRVRSLNDSVGRVLLRTAEPTHELVSSQLQQEFTALGLEPSTPDPRLIEETLPPAVRTIASWNIQLAPATIRTLQSGLLRGETYRQLAERVTRVQAPSPIATARAHMLANVRYAVVNGSNAARNGAYIASRDATGTSVRKMWWADITNCCLNCARLHGTIVELEEDFPWEHLHLTITPFQNRLPHCPLHPACRCRILPVTPEVLAATDLRRLKRDRDARLREVA